MGDNGNGDSMARNNLCDITHILFQGLTEFDPVLFLADHPRVIELIAAALKKGEFTEELICRHAPGAFTDDDCRDSNVTTIFDLLRFCIYASNMFGGLGVLPYAKFLQQLEALGGEKDDDVETPRDTPKAFIEAAKHGVLKSYVDDFHKGNVAKAAAAIREAYETGGSLRGALEILQPFTVSDNTLLKWLNLLKAKSAHKKSPAVKPRVTTSFKVAEVPEKLALRPKFAQMATNAKMTKLGFAKLVVALFFDLQSQKKVAARLEQDYDVKLSQREFSDWLQDLEVPPLQGFGGRKAGAPAKKEAKKKEALVNTQNVDFKIEDDDDATYRINDVPEALSGMRVFLLIAAGLAKSRSLRAIATKVVADYLKMEYQNGKPRPSQFALAQTLFPLYVDGHGVKLASNDVGKIMRELGISALDVRKQADGDGEANPADFDLQVFRKPRSLDDTQWLELQKMIAASGATSLRDFVAKFTSEYADITAQTRQMFLNLVINKEVPTEWLTLKKELEA